MALSCGATIVNETIARANAVPHIFTLTGNLLAERTLTYRSWAPGKTQRAIAESFQVGGKGINVSKMLNRLGVTNTALCFAGGASGVECEAWLRKHAFSFHAFATSASTRSGTVVRAEAQPETTFLGSDVAPDPASIAACAQFLDVQADSQVLALCGSFPGWSNASFDLLRSAIERWQRRGIVTADVYGPPLAWLIEKKIALVKINAGELRALGADLAHLPAQAAAQRWVVTDGPNPVRIRDRDGVLSMVTPPTIQEVSATGSGDVLFACVLDGLYRRRTSLLEAVSFALPFAAANAAHAGVAEFPDPFARRVT